MDTANEGITLDAEKCRMMHEQVTEIGSAMYHLASLCAALRDDEERVKHLPAVVAEVAQATEGRCLVMSDILQGYEPDSSESYLFTH